VHGLDWTIPADAFEKYQETFSALDREGKGSLTGAQAVPHLRKSGLQDSVLRAIWNLTDVTKDGKLDRLEFALAAHLIAKHGERGWIIPTQLPAQLHDSARKLSQTYTPPAASASSSLSQSEFAPPLVSPVEAGQPAISGLVSVDACALLEQGVQLFGGDVAAFQRALSTYADLSARDAAFRALQQQRAGDSQSGARVWSTADPHLPRPEGLSDSELMFATVREVSPPRRAPVRDCCARLGFEQALRSPLFPHRA